MENNYDFLLKIGFTLNEAKVYLALIKNRAMNGYEVAKVSGVSRSLVYDVLDRLVSKGYVIKCKGETNFYTALDYEKIIDKIKEENQNNLYIAKEKLKALSIKEHDSEYIFNIKGFDKFIDKAKELIATAKKEISLSIWKEEFILLEDELIKAINRGIKIYLFSFSRINLKGAEVFSYGLEDPNNLFPYRRITIIVDNLDTLVGENIGDKSISIYTKNHALMSLTIDEIVLNVFWLKMIQHKNLFDSCKTSKGFLQALEILKNEMNISTNMTKNFMVFDYQFGGNKNGNDKN